MDRWEGYSLVEPWGQPAADQRTGQLAAVIGSVNGVELSSDIIRTGIREQQTQSAEEQIQAVQRHVQGHRINAGLE